jgi:hypothetical protein
MNISTGQVRDVTELNRAEKQSGDWIPLRGKWKRKYAQKQPATDADRRRIVAAEAKRLRRKARRLDEAIRG